MLENGSTKARAYWLCSFGGLGPAAGVPVVVAVLLSELSKWTLAWGSAHLGFPVAP